MSAKPFIKFLISAILIQGVFFSDCLAQPIKLKDISRFELTVHGGGLSSDLRKIEVIPGKNGWDCYQTRYRAYTLKGFVNDSSRTFLKSIPASPLEHLLTIIAKQDTGVNIDLFKIDKKELTKYTDSVADVPPTLAQRAEFVSALQSDSLLKKALYKAVHPRPMDDKTYYGITITTLNSSPITVFALSFAARYYLPWHINNIESYNPEISSIFAFISGDKRFEVQQKQWLYQDLAKYTYWEFFRTRFNWDNLKSGHPASYAIIADKLAPHSVIVNEGYVVIRAPSSRLPRYADWWFGFRPDDTATLKRYKRYEDTLAAMFKKENFLFNYLSTRPDSKITFIPGRMGDAGAYYFRDIKKYFSGIESYDYKTSQLIEVGGGADLKSRWILLPDNTLLLMEFEGTQLTNQGVKFMNISSSVLSGLCNYKTNGVCIVFDASGKVLHNYGAAEMPHY